MGFSQLKHGELSVQEKEHKNELLMYLAHDLKTPLTSMIGYINHILDHKVDQEQLDTSIRITYEKAQRLDDLHSGEAVSIVPTKSF